MKILFLIHRYPGYGGIETVTTVLANYFKEIGYDINIMSYAQENEELLKKLNSRVGFFRFIDNENILAAPNRAFLYDYIMKEKPDVIIYQDSYSKLFELLADIKSKISCKIITVEHNSPDAIYRIFVNYIRTEKMYLSFRSILKKMLNPYFILSCFVKERANHRFVYKFSDEYILLSDKFIPVFKKVSGLKNIDKIKTIENPVTVNPVSVDLENKEKIVLYIGRLDYGQKRVDRLLNVWSRIINDVSDWKLIIVGDGPDRIQLENYVKEKSILNVFFEGPQLNVEKYYAKSSILCLTSNIEGWPLVLSEGMSYGCVPVLFDSFASATDIIKDKTNGRLIKPFDKIHYASVLLELIQNKEEREKVAKQAINDSARFSLVKIGDKWQKLLIK